MAARSRLRSAGQATRAGVNPSMWSAERSEPFAIGDRIDHLVDHEWHPAVVFDYTPKGQPEPWRVEFKYDAGGTGAVLLDDAFNQVRFVHFRVGDAIMHESGGEWLPATVTAYTGQGEESAWRVEFEYDKGGFASVFLDDGFNTVVRAKTNERQSEPGLAPEPEPEPDPEPESEARDFADLMAELQADEPPQGADVTAELQELRQQLAEAKDDARRHEMARASAEERAAWCRKQQKHAERWAAQLSHARWAQRRTKRDPPERVVRDDLRMSKFSDEAALNLRVEHSRVHWQLSKEVWARLTYPNTGRALRQLSLQAIMARLHADQPGVRGAGGRPWLLFPSYERRAELFWKWRASTAECEAAGERPTHERPIARRMLMTVIGAQRAIGELWPALKNQVALGRAFRAACGHSELVEWAEFAPLLRATIFFQEMWARLEEISNRDDAALNVNDFRAACALMGQRLSDADCQAEHRRLHTQEKGRVFFLTFCQWLARRHIYNDEDRLEPIPWATPFELQVEKEVAENIAKQEGIRTRRAQQAADRAAAIMKKDADLQQALRAEEQKDPEARAITLLFGPLWVNITNGNIHGTASVEDVSDAVFSDPIIQALVTAREKRGKESESRSTASVDQPQDDASIYAIKEKAKAITKQMDTDGDGVVTWEEFVNFVLLTLFGERASGPNDLDKLNALKKPRNFKSKWQAMRLLRQAGLREKSQDMDESMLRALKAVAGEPSQSSLSADTSVAAAPGDNHPIAPQLSRDSIEALSPRGGVASEQLSTTLGDDEQQQEEDFETGPGEFYYEAGDDEYPKVGVEEALGLMARGVLDIDTKVWASGMDDWVSWAEVKDEWMAGIQEPLFEVGEWVYVWYEFKWHYATVTRYTPSNADSRPWSVDYTFADYSQGVFDGTIMLDDAFDTIRHGPRFRVGDRINVREQNGSQWFEATVTDYVPKGHATEPWRVEFSHDEGGAKQSVLLDDATHTVRRVFYRQGDRIKVRFTGTAKERAAVIGKQVEADLESPKAVLTDLIKEVNGRLQMTGKQKPDEEEIYKLKQHRVQLHAEYEKQVGEPYYPGDWLSATVTSYCPRGDSEPWRVSYFFDIGGAGAQLLQQGFDQVRMLHRSSGDPNHVKLPPLNIGALFQRFLGLIFEEMDADRDGSVSRKEAIVAARDNPVIRTLLGLPTNERQMGLGKGLRAEDKKKFDEMFKGLDSDRSGSITISEFITFMKAKLGDVPGLISEEEHDEAVRQQKAAAEEDRRQRQRAPPVLAQLCGALSAKHFGRRLAQRVSKWIRLPRQPVRAVDWQSSRTLSVPNNHVREKLFTRWARQNGEFLTLSDVSHAVEELWPWWMVKREQDPKTGTSRLVPAEWKPPLVRAYRAADTGRCGWIGRAQFRMLLLYTVYFNDAWERLDQVHPIIRTPGETQNIELDDTARVDEEQFVFMCCELGVIKGHHQDPLKRIEARKLFRELRDSCQPLAVRNAAASSVDDAEVGSTEASALRQDPAAPTFVYFSDFCSWLATTHVQTRGPHSQKTTVELVQRIVAHCESNETHSCDEAVRFGAFYPLVKMLSATSTRSADIQLLACKAIFLLSKGHARRQNQIIERGALLPLTQIVLGSPSEAAIWATGVMANVCNNKSISLIGGSQESVMVCDALIHATVNAGEQQLEHATRAIAGVARTNAANRAKLVESGVIELLVGILSGGTQKLAEARAKAERDLETRSRLEAKPEPWQQEMNAYFMLFEEDREMYPVGGHRFKGTASTGPFIRGIPRAAMTKHAREQLVDHARRLVALEERLETMTMETLHGLCPGAKRWAAEALATIVLEAGHVRDIDTMGSAVCAAGVLEPLLLLVHHSRDEQRIAGLRALAAIAPCCAELAPEHAHEVSQMLCRVAEASKIGLPRCWAVTSLFALLSSKGGARLRLPSSADAKYVAAALCEAVERCNQTSIRSATAAALGLALLCRGDEELLTAMVVEEKGLAPRKFDVADYHSEEEPSSDDDFTVDDDEETADEDDDEEETLPPVVTTKSGVKALLGLLSSRRKSGQKDLDWSSASAACRALSVCAAHAVQLRKSMGTMDNGAMLKKLVKTVADAERATEAERVARRAQSALCIDRHDGLAAAPVHQNIELASLMLWSMSAIAALAKDCVENQLAFVLLSQPSKQSSSGLEEVGIVHLLGRILRSSAAEVFPTPPALLEQTALAVTALAQNVDETKAQLMNENVAPVLVSLLGLAGVQPPATRAAAAQAIGALARNTTAHKSNFIQLGVVPGLVRCVQGPKTDGDALKLAAGAALQCIAVNNPSGMRAIIRDGGKVALQLTQRMIQVKMQQEHNERSSLEQARLQRVSEPTSYGGDSRGAIAPPVPRKVTWDDLDGGGGATGVTVRAARKAMAFEDPDKACTLSAPFPNRASAVPAPSQALHLVSANEAARRVEHGRRKGSAGLWPAAAAAASASPRMATSRRPKEPKIGWRTQLAGGAKVRNLSRTTGGAKRLHGTAKLGAESRWISGRRGYVRGEARGRRRRWLATENLHYANGGGQPDNLFRGNY